MILAESLLQLALEMQNRERRNTHQWQLDVMSRKVNIGLRHYRATARQIQSGASAELTPFSRAVATTGSWDKWDYTELSILLVLVGERERIYFGNIVFIKTHKGKG